jgi:hypothetical protein
MCDEKSQEANPAIWSLLPGFCVQFLPASPNEPEFLQHILAIQSFYIDKLKNLPFIFLNLASGAV